MVIVLPLLSAAWRGLLPHHYIDSNVFLRLLWEVNILRKMIRIADFLE
jgi:hypothetical protein